MLCRESPFLNPPHVLSAMMNWLLQNYAFSVCKFVLFNAVLHVMVKPVSLRCARWTWHFAQRRWRRRPTRWDHLWRWESPFVTPIYSWTRKRRLCKSKTWPRVSVGSLNVFASSSHWFDGIYMLWCASRKVDALQQENLELVRRLASQEESLSYSNLQLDQRSSEGQALSRQLEAALADVKQQVHLTGDGEISKNICSINKRGNRLQIHIWPQGIIIVIVFSHICRSRRSKTRPPPEKRPCRPKSWSWKLRRAEGMTSCGFFAGASSPWVPRST